MTYFWTSAHLRGDCVYVTGYMNGRRFEDTHEIKPYLFLPDEAGEHVTLEGKRVRKRTFVDVRAARDFVKQNEGVDNAEYYGMTTFLYPWLNDEFAGTIAYDSTVINRVSIDIETMADGGFPSPHEADKEVTAITLSRRRGNERRILQFATRPYIPKHPGVEFHLCKDERAMFELVLDFWNDPDVRPDVLTGWNIEGFDVPFLINRTRRILGEGVVKMWSPWRIVQERDIARGQSVGSKGSTQTVYELYGISILDYMELYKKFSFKNQESFSLDHISSVELGERKLYYSQYESLHEFYLKDHQGYMEYNLDDTLKIDRLDEKMKLIDLVLAMAYNAKVTFNDTMTTTRPWDVLIHNYLLQDNIVVPQQAEVEDRFIMGGYVKDTVPGMYKWVTSFDLNSLYPHVIMQCNISPETYRGVVPGWEATKISTSGIVCMDLDKFLAHASRHEEELLFNDQIVSGIGALFSREKMGFIPTLMKKLYDDRVVFKKMMLAAEQKYEDTKDPELLKEISRCHNMQMALKIFLNSGYGALANKYFRWFMPDLAESVTSFGQVAITWIERRFNEYMNKLMKTTDVDYVIMADTDSIYLNLESLVTSLGLEDTNQCIDFIDKACKAKLEPYVDKCFKELLKIHNGLDQRMVMKRETISNRGVFSAKKMYILNVWDSEGVRYAAPKLKMKGVSAVRSSTPLVVRDMIKKSYAIIMDKEERDLHAFVEKQWEEFKTLPYAKVAFPRSCNGLKEYSDASNVFKKGTPIQVKGSLYYNKMIRDMKLEEKYELISEGEKIKFCYLRTPNHAHTPVIACKGELPPEFALDEFVDYETQFEKTYLDPVSKITELIGWSPEPRPINLMDLLK